MRKTLLCSLLSLMGVGTAFAQFNEGFEGSFPADGWKVMPDPATVTSNAMPGMTVVTYSSVSDFGQYISGYNHGGVNVLKSNGGGFGSVSATKAAVPTDSWLITPAVTVSDQDYLSFMMLANCGFNGGSSTKGHFEMNVLVSVTDTAMASFTDTIYAVTPKGVLNWHAVTLDLSHYAGRIIHLAFHDWGVYTANSFVKNVTYLDDIKIIQGNRSDVTVSAVTSPAIGCEVSQPVTATVANTGATVSSFDLCCQVGSGEVMRQTFATSLVAGESQTFTMDEQALLTVGAANSVKVWVENPSVVDANIDNDSMVVSVPIGTELVYPYLSTAQTLPNDFQPSSAYSAGGWNYETSTQAWAFSKQTAVKTHYLESNCILLPKGTLRVSFEYQSSSPFDVKVLLGEFTYSGYTEVGTSDSYPAEQSAWVKVGFNVTVPEAGLYSVALLPTLSNRNSVTYFRNIRFSDPYEDVSALAITAPVASARLRGSDLEVSASFKNNGAHNLSDIPFYYRLGSGDVHSCVVPALFKDSTVTVTFADKASLTTSGEQILKVWSALAVDGDLANDTLTQTLFVYEPKSFPYTTGFEDELDYYSWSSINVDADQIYWGIISASSSSPAISGAHSVYINSYAGVEHNDWVISPAIDMPKGKARVSFYYTCYYSTGVTRLKVYLGNAADPAAMTTPLTAVVVDNQFTPRMGSAYIDIPEAGCYYIGFYDEGLGRDILLDDIHVDAGEDLVALSAAFGAATDFDLTTSTVSLTLANRGMSPAGNIPVSYSVNGGAAVSETIAGPLAAGDTMTYTFVTPADISVAGTYSVVASVSYDGDVDAANNVMTSASISNYPSKSVPCTQTFADEAECNYWTVEGGWAVGINFSTSNAAYDDTGALRHLNAASNAGGDWAYSACMNIPAGTYELSYFYRTMMNMTTQYYLCNYKIYIGTARTPEAMTIEVDDKVDVTNPVKQYQKVIKTVTIPEDGKYYIGICYTGTALSAALYLDCFTLAAPVTTGLTLPYVADFATKADEWYRYNTATSHFEQWSQKTADSEAYMTTTLTSAESYASRIAAGILRSPAVQLQAGDVVHASFDYSIVDAVSADGASQSVSLLMADVDTPDNYTTLVAQGTDSTGVRCTAAGDVVIEKSGIYYFGFKTASTIAAQAFNVYSCSLTGIEVGIHNVAADSAEQNVYDLNGRLVLRNATADLLKHLDAGVYLIRGKKFMVQ